VKSVPPNPGVMVSISGRMQSLAMVPYGFRKMGWSMFFEQGLSKRIL
jgi:hypothetical protein